MARIQILELPMVHHGDTSETPFIVIVDQVSDDESPLFSEDLWKPFKTDTGARSVVVTADTIDIPANGPLPTAQQTEADPNDSNIHELIKELCGPANRGPQPKPMRNEPAPQSDTQS